MAQEVLKSLTLDAFPVLKICHNCFCCRPDPAAVLGI